jgi:hypothetical protein
MPNAAIWEGRRALTDDPATSPETFRRAGRELLELNQLAEALELLGRAGDEEGLRLILERAVAEGHYFLYQGAAAKLGDIWRPETHRPDLERLADAAKKNGQALYAARARARLAEI